MPHGLGGIASGEEREPAEHPNHDQVEQSNSHELDHAPARSNSSSQPVRRVLARYRAAMNGETKITASHLDRQAVVYVRQSSLAQVRNHTESTTRQ
jgi:hypothetical protein